MKKRFLFFGALLLNAFGLHSQSLNHLQGCDKGSMQNVAGSCWDYPYILIWSDEFNEYEHSNWELRPNRGSIGDVQEYNQLDNATVENGVMTISAKREAQYALATHWLDSNYVMGDGQTNYRQFYYTSSNLWSKYVFGNGYFEMLCKVPSEAGYWPAFWLYNEVGGVNTELDVFEMWNDNPYDVSLSIHNGQMCSDDYSGGDYSNGWHKFGVSWDDWMIVWYIDNVAVQHTYKWYHPYVPAGIPCEAAETVESFLARINSSYPESPMQMVMNLAVRDGNHADSVAMEIAYVRFYQQRRNCNTEKTYTTRASLGLDDDDLIVDLHKPYYHHETGQIINVLGNITVDADQQLKLTARETLNFDVDPLTGLPVPNSSIVFDIQPGANFEAIIDPNICSNTPQMLPIHDVIDELPDLISDDLLSDLGGQGITETSSFSKESISVSPNPSNQDNITVVSPKVSKVIFSNSQGRKVKEIDVLSGSNQLNVSDLGSGVYYLYFEALNKTIKWVKI